MANGRAKTGPRVHGVAGAWSEEVPGAEAGSEAEPPGI